MKRWEGDTPPSVKRIYLFNNGLNERHSLEFYYNLAYQLANDSEAACIIHPFPGHLTRFAFTSEYTATPLDSYLDDATNLFRQYLRHMLETRWLLSILVPMRSYQVLPGFPLIDEGTNDEDEGRSVPRLLAEAIHSEWSLLNNSNPKNLNAPSESFHADDIEASILAIRGLIGWNAVQGVSPPSLNDKKGLSPFIHVVGYSLGGFLAQATFFTWPYAISSCTTICSGGALRDIAITAFAYPEEWQMVIRGLRHGMNEAFSDSTRIISAEDRIAGVARQEFNYLSDIFRDIFLQDDLGSYPTRVKEFVKRLFFVVGGNDPIVSVRSVLGTTPSGGINMLEVADLDHFVWSPAMQDEAQEWRSFWFPQVSQLIKQFSARCEIIYHKTLLNNWYTTNPIRQLPDKDSSASTESRKFDRASSSNEVLSSAHFQSHLDAIIEKFLEHEKAPLSRSSCLFIFRNEIPAPLLNDVILRQHSLAIHHADDEVGGYFNKLLHWQGGFKDNRRRIMLVVQKQWFDGFRNNLGASLRKLDGAGANRLSQEDLRHTSETFIREWCSTDSGFLNIFDTTQETTPALDNKYYSRLENAVKEKMSLLPKEPLIINTLPEIVIYVSPIVMERLLGHFDHERDIRSQLCEKMPQYLLGLFVNLSKTPQIEDMKTLIDWIDNEEIMLIQLSRADFNPRHRGVRVKDPKLIIRLLTHCTLAYARSHAFAPDILDGFEQK